MLEWATDYFESKKLESPRLLIEHTLAFVLGLEKRLDLYLMFDKPLSLAELDRLRPLIQRLAKGEPLQYVIGNQPFYGISIKTDQRALIPRPETEELVEIIIKDLCENTVNQKILDIGTGTACIPLAIKSAYAGFECYGADISTEALSLAKENSETLDLKIELLQYDFYKPALTEFLHHFDVVISNPPYIGEDENTVDEHVHQWEPHLALYADDIVQVYRSVIDASSQYLKPNGRLYLELNPIYMTKIKDYAEQIFNSVEVVVDLNKKDRFMRAYGLKKHVDNL